MKSVGHNATYSNKRNLNMFAKEIIAITIMMKPRKMQLGQSITIRIMIINTMNMNIRIAKAMTMNTKIMLR